MSERNLRNELERSCRIAVLTHVHPDGDALCSATALVLGLRSLGKEVSFFTERPVEETYRFFTAESQLIETMLPDIYDWMIAMDCGAPDRLGAAESAFLAHPHTLVVDHHHTNTGYAHTNIIDGDSASTAEMVFDLLNEWQITITTEMATALYVGVVTDTGRFAYSATTEKTHQVAGALLRLGADSNEIHHRLYEVTTLASLQAKAEVIKTLRFFCNDRLAVGFLPRSVAQTIDVGDAELDGMSNMLRNLQGVEVGAFLREREDGAYKVSLRSERIVDVSAIAASFMGGGHARAAGYTSNATQEETIEALQKAVASTL